MTRETREEKITKIVELQEWRGETQIVTESGKHFLLSTNDLREMPRRPTVAVIESDGGLLQVH